MERNQQRLVDGKTSNFSTWRVNFPFANCMVHCKSISFNNEMRIKFVTYHQFVRYHLIIRKVAYVRRKTHHKHPTLSHLTPKSKTILQRPIVAYAHQYYRRVSVTKKMRFKKMKLFILRSDFQNDNYFLMKSKD